MMKKAVLQFTACCMAAGVSVASFSSVALADTSNALAGVDAAVVSEGEAEDAQGTTQSETAETLAGAAGTEAAEGDAAYTVTSTSEVNGAYTFGYGVVTADEEEEAAEDSGEEITAETAGETLAGDSDTQVVEPTVDENETEEEADEETETESETESETALAGVTLAINVDEDEDADEADEDGTKEAGTSADEADAVDAGEQAFAQCDDYINVRASADADGEVVGKLYNDNEVTILSKAGAWYKIQSGNVVGYVKAEYFATGEEAEKIAQTAAYTVATVKADDLLVRSAADKNAESVDMVDKNEELDVISEDGDWVKVRLSDGTVGYVSAKYVECNTYYSTGETLEEEQERLDGEWESYLDEEEAAAQEAQAVQTVYYYDDEPSYSEFSYVDYTEPYYEEDYTDSYYTDGYYTDEYYMDAYYTDGYYTDSYYTDAYYTDGYYTDEYYTDGYYTDEYYTDGYYTDEYYTDSYYTDGSYTDTYYTDTTTYTDYSSVDAAYQNYLEKQAEADAACSQADEQLVYDTYNAAVAAYQEYLDTVAAADAASAGSYSYTEPTDAESSYTETYTESYTYVDSTSVDAAYQNYLEKQAEADAACLQADEQLVYDTYNAAVAAYQEYLNALNGQASAVTETTTVYETAEETTPQQTYVEEIYSEETTVEPVAETASSGSSGSSIASYATQFVGNPYVYGGTSLTNGADCSGFTQSVFANFGISIPRTAAEQANSGTSVDLSDIQAGDLLFYSDGSGISHVSMYIGDGQVVHASTSSTGIIISSVDYRTPVSAKRYW